jgi:hypothetical protein
MRSGGGTMGRRRRNLRHASLLHSAHAHVPPSLHFPTEPLHAVLRSPEPLPPRKFESPLPWPHHGELPSPVAPVSNHVCLTSPSSSPCCRTRIRAPKIVGASPHQGTPHHGPLHPLHRCATPVASSPPCFRARRLALPLMMLSHGPCRPVRHR